MTIPTLTQVQQLAMLNARRTVWTGDTPILGLYTEGPPEGQPLTALGDLTEPTGDWYATVAAVLSEVYNGPTGVLSIAIGGGVWNYTGTDPAETIIGVYLAGTVSGLICYWLLPTPVVMGTTLDSLISDVVDMHFPAIIGGPHSA